MPSRPRNSRRLARTMFDIVTLLGGLLAVWYLWPSSLGGSTRFIVVQGSSMEPTFSLGDVVIVRDNAQPQVGDIIVFHIPGDEPAAGMLVIHRLKSIRADGSYQTQGDNRTTADSFHITGNDVVGTPVYSIPRLGRLIGLSSDPWVIGAALGLLTTIHLWPKKGRRGSSDTPDPPETVDTLDALDDDRTTSDRDFEAEAEAWLAAELASVGER